MKKRGFTLVELLGAITILAVIALLAFPPIIEQVRKSKDNLSNAMRDVIFSATGLFTSANNNQYPATEGNVYCIKLRQLTDQNFLKAPLKDPKTGGRYR